MDQIVLTIDILISKIEKTIQEIISIYFSNSVDIMVVNTVYVEKIKKGIQKNIVDNYYMVLKDVIKIQKDDYYFYEGS